MRIRALTTLGACLLAGCAVQTPGVKTTRDVVYGHVGARELHVDLDQPDPAPAGKLPVIVYIHGGAFKLGNHHGGENRSLAGLGYFCVNVEYRLSGEAKWPAQINDCKAALRWVRSKAVEYNLDVDRIGVWGHSAGGHLAALLGTSGDVKALEGDSGSPGFSTRVACVVDCFGPTNFLAMGHGEAGSPESELLGKPLAEVPELVRQADPCTYVTKTTPPFLLQHGTHDRSVPFGQSQLLHDALVKAGVEVTLHPVDGADHIFRGASRATLAALTAEQRAFFAQHLKRP